MSGHEQRGGDWRVGSELSGFNGWASESALTWDGRRVLRRFVGEERQRHPQDFVTGIPDDPTVPWTRPLTDDVFLAPGDVTPESL